MRATLTLILWQVVAIVCAIGSVILAYDGAAASVWGWFLLAAVLTTVKVVEVSQDGEE